MGGGSPAGRASPCCCAPLPPLPPCRWAVWSAHRLPSEGALLGGEDSSSRRECILHGRWRTSHVSSNRPGGDDDKAAFGVGDPPPPPSGGPRLPICARLACARAASWPGQPPRASAGGVPPDGGGGGAAQRLRRSTLSTEAPCSGLALMACRPGSYVCACAISVACCSVAADEPACVGMGVSRWLPSAPPTSTAAALTWHAHLVHLRSPGTSPISSELCFPSSPFVPRWSSSSRSSLPTPLLVGPPSQHTPTPAPWLPSRPPLPSPPPMASRCRRWSATAPRGTRCGRPSSLPTRCLRQRASALPRMPCL